MEHAEIYNRVKERFGDDVGEFVQDAIDPYLTVAPGKVLECARFLADDEALSFDSLMCLSATDYADTVLITYHLHSMKHNHRFVMKTEVSKDDPKVPSVESVWRTADWHEREAYDLLGVEFQGHPDLTRILLPEDWEGFPLRKDYKAPDEYRGMKI